jgi:secondary thiamine-phosphate synthase enzyme
MVKLTISTSKRDDWVDITSRLTDTIQSNRWQNGLLTVFVPHTTAAVTINENADPDVTKDLISTLDRLIPWNGAYLHQEGNSAAHLKATLVGASATLLVEEGQMMRGTWQGIYLCEFDGPRKREVWLSFVPDNEK